MKLEEQEKTRHKILDLKYMSTEESAGENILE